MSLKSHESIVESSIELEQEYKMCTGEDIAIFEPKIDVKDVDIFGLHAGTSRPGGVGGGV